MALIYRLADACVYANSGHRTDIQNAIDQAFIEGIKDVFIPAGSYNFVEVGETWITVQVPAGINVFGAGCLTTEFDETDQVDNWLTVLKMPYSVGVAGGDPSASWFKVIGTEDPNKPSRMSGFAMVGYRYFDNSDTKLYEAIRFISVINFRADHLLLQDIAGNGIVIANDILPNVYGCGVVDHCKLINSTGVPAPYETRSLGYGVYARLSWSSDFWDDNRIALIGKYDLRTVFVEDCYFQRWRHSMASNQAVHYVFRYNTIKNDWGYVGSVDAHGQENAANTATMVVEIYGNTILDPIMPRQYTQGGVGLRGGCGVVFNNTIGGYYYGIQLFYEAIDDKYALRDMYVWGNTITGATEPHMFGSGLVENVNYFLYALPGYEPYPYPHPLTIEGEQPATTPFLGELEEGVYEISVPSIVTDMSATYNFKQWEDGSTNPVRTINLTADTTITATYELVQLLKYTLVINTVTGGTTEPALGAHEYEAGTIVTVTAIANEGYTFKRFELDGEVKLQNPINVGMDADHTLLAVFETAAPPISPAIASLFILALLGGVGALAVAKKGGE